MENKEIFARIAYDIGKLPYLGGPEITIGMTRELYARLAPLEMLTLEGNAVTLFGCKVKLIANRGLWWIVGYMGTAEEG